MSDTPLMAAIDPCALASITTGTMLCTAGFGAVSHAAEWVLGYPIWTHEFIDPKIQAEMIAAVLAQFPDMPTEAPADWKALRADLIERYGDTVQVTRGTGSRDHNPIDTLHALMPDKPIEVHIVDPDAPDAAPIQGGPWETTDD